MKTVEVGAKDQVECIVDHTNTAQSMMSGSLPVFATPSMIALMEWAAAKCAGAFLDENETTVGTMVNIKHLSATPVGMTIRAEAEITETEGRRINYRIAAYDDAGMIGEGTHERFVINREKFMQKVETKNETKL